MRRYYRYDGVTGVFNGWCMQSADPVQPFNDGAGLYVSDDPIDWQTLKVDIDTGDLVPYQPPSPPDSEWRTHEWDAVNKRWVVTPTLAALKVAKWREIKAHAVTLDQADITVTTYTFPASYEARAVLTTKVILAREAVIDGQAFSVEIETSDGDYVTANATQLKAIVRAIEARRDSIFSTAKTLRQQIAAATTPAEVAAVVWP